MPNSACIYYSFSFNSQANIPPYHLFVIFLDPCNCEYTPYHLCHRYEVTVSTWLSYTHNQHHY